MWERAVYVFIKNNIELAKCILKKDYKNFIATVSITSFFERKSIQVCENENPKPSDRIRNDSSDQACSTAKRSGSTTASIEPSPGNVNSLNVDLPRKPYQPKLKQFPLKEVGKQKRFFNPKLFDEFKFLHYREESDSVIFHTCAVGDKNNLLKIDTKKEKKFIETGFSNRKKAIEKFLAHARSATHTHSTEVLNITSGSSCKASAVLPCNASQ